MVPAMSSSAVAAPSGPPRAPTTWVDVLRIVVLVLFHLGAVLGVIRFGWSWIAVAVCVGLYLVRMFAITGIYHRYFSHRTFRTNRFWQFVFTVAGCSAMQKGPLWWAAHHRHHHRTSDTPEDVHSPVQHGLWQSHFGWFLSSATGHADRTLMRDFQDYPELRWIDRRHLLIPFALAIGCFALGSGLRHAGVDTSGMQMLVWGFFVSTALLANGTYTINSLSHRFGCQRYDTGDTSRNNWLLALITLGEGWHNNHHRYPASTRQGFRWWEIDVTFYVLRALSAVRIVRDLKPVPAAIVAEGSVRRRVAFVRPRSPSSHAA